METPCFWRRSRPMQFFLLMCLYLPTLIRARSMPQGSDFSSSGEVLALRRPDVSSQAQDRARFGTVVAACAKHHIACHLLRGHSTVQAPIGSGEYARENERMLMTFTTQDYNFERPDSNPATFVYVPVVASPLYSPYSTVGTGNASP